MASVTLEGVWVEFPIYNAGSRSLKNSVLSLGSGGRISCDSQNRIVVEALADLSLHFEHGDRIGLVGHNGAGKTTVLRAIAGIYEPSRGSIVCQGQVTSLFDVAFGMDMEATGYENIVLRGLFLGLTPRQVRARTGEIAEFAELGEYLAMPVRTYSAGMLLRLAFAVCTSVEPEILLMDEWISVGDAHFMGKAQARLNDLVSSAGIIVLASHSLPLIRQVCNKAVLLERGRVTAFGPVEDIIRIYQPDG